MRAMIAMPYLAFPFTSSYIMYVPRPKSSCRDMSQQCDKPVTVPRSPTFRGGLWRDLFLLRLRKQSSLDHIFLSAFSLMAHVTARITSACSKQARMYIWMEHEVYFHNTIHNRMWKNGSTNHAEKIIIQSKIQQFFDVNQNFTFVSNGQKHF